MSNQAASPPPTPGDAEIDPLIGKELCGGKYRVLRLLGRGGMGSVYLVEHNILMRLQALKFIGAPGLKIDDHTLRRFVKEAQLCASLDATGIVKVYDVEHAPDGSPFIVMEYLEGESVRARVDRVGPIPWQEALGYVIMACKALSAVHAKGIYHRDIKPDNLFLRSSGELAGQLAILDFGIAKLDRPSETGTVTQEGLFVGTPGYVSFEQIKEPRTLDGRGDVYSLAGVLYFMLSARSQWPGLSAQECFIKVLAKEPPDGDIAEMVPGLPAPVAGLVRKGLEHAREERIPSVDAFRQAAEAILRGETPALGKSGPADATVNERSIPRLEDRATVLTPQISDSRQPEAPPTRASNRFATPTVAGTSVPAAGGRSLAAFAVVGVLFIGAVVGGWLLLRDPKPSEEAKVVPAALAPAPVATTPVPAAPEPAPTGAPAAPAPTAPPTTVAPPARATSGKSRHRLASAAAPTEKPKDKSSMSTSLED